MKIVDGMVMTKVGDDWMAVATGAAAERLKGVVRLNETGHDVWEGLAAGLSEDQIVQSLTERYEVDDARARRSVQSVVAKLREANLLED